ncbi:MAG: dTDP-4-dehydrorhamnose 3,5-epimerase [Deltaproteobacteria bacterium]|nr:dTDP-4-dehydrorhamnose 3,5-epimerase [Deltaproteobacteria bacterium]
MQIEETDIPGVLVVTPKVFGDERGFFLETYNKEVFQQAGIAPEFVQDNHSKSTQGVVRGLHYQKKFPQGKLIWVIQGEVLDVIVDIRRGSPTFAKWISILISAENKKQVWIPGGLAHGFSVLSETAEFCYKVTDYYHPEDEGGIRWNDPQLKIDWQVQNPLLSEKDRQLPLLDEAEEDLPLF